MKPLRTMTCWPSSTTDRSASGARSSVTSRTSIGGMNSQEKYGDQTASAFHAGAEGEQAQAMKFISDNAFQTPTWLIDTDILRKIEPNGEVTRIVTAQSSLDHEFAQRCAR